MTTIGKEVKGNFSVLVRQFAKERRKKKEIGS
jgi:hypothetical protein